MNIQTYPMFSADATPGSSGTSAPEVGSTTATPVEDTCDKVLEMSDHAAMTDEPTMRKKDASVRPVTLPPNLPVSA